MSFKNLFVNTFQIIYIETKTRPYIIWWNAKNWIGEKTYIGILYDWPPDCLAYVVCTYIYVHTLYVSMCIYLHNTQIDYPKMDYESKTSRRDAARNIENETFFYSSKILKTRRPKISGQIWTVFSILNNLDVYVASFKIDTALTLRTHRQPKSWVGWSTIFRILILLIVPFEKR